MEPGCKICHEAICLYRDSLGSRWLNSVTMIIMNLKKTFKSLQFLSPISPTTLTIISAALVMAGVTILLVLIIPSGSVETAQEVTQTVPTGGSNTYGTHGIRVPLPAPSEAVNALVHDGWTLDLPDNNEYPYRCRHKVVVNGVTLTACSNHSQIAESLAGGCSVWEAGTDSIAHLSLPQSVDHLDSMAVRWHLSRKSGPVLTASQEQRHHELGFGGIALCCIGSIGLAMSQLLLRKNWGTWLIAVTAGSAGGLATSCWLLGTMDTAVGLWLSTFVSMSVAVICMVMLALGLVLAISVRWLNPMCGMSAPATSIVALTLGASVAVLASGWVSSKVPTSPYDNSGPGSVLFDGRIPFSDAGGWYVGTNAVNNGQVVQWAARRPVHALIRSGEFELAGGNYQWSLLIQAAIFSLAVSALTISAWSAITPAVSLIIWVGAFRVGQGFLCSYLTESVGYSCACLSLAYLLTGCKDNRFGFRLAGITWLGMAWLTRPGPLGLLAVPIVLEAIAPTARRFRRTATAIAVLASVLLGGKVVFHLVAAHDATENANAAPTIYGLAIGKSWDGAYKDFYAASPERSKLEIPEQTALMYREAWSKFIANPTPAFNKSWTDLQDGFGKSVIALPARLWLSLPTMFTPWQPSERSVGWILLVSGTVTTLVMIKRKNLVGLLLSGSVIGLIASLPIIWGDGGLRGVIIATPSMLVFLSLLFAVPEALNGKQSAAGSKWAWGGISHAASAAILSALVIGLAVYALRRSPNPAPVTPMVIFTSSDPAVFISDKAHSANLRGPAILTKSDAIQSVKDRGLSVYKLDDFIETLDADTLIAFKFHSETPSQMLVIENAGTPRSGKLVVEATGPTANPYFIRATKWHWAE